jgi:hypothetical protein
VELHLFRAGQVLSVSSASCASTIHPEKNLRHILQTTAWVLFSISTGLAVASEEAKFDVIISDGEFQVRDYADQVVAEVVIDDDFEDAGSRAFRTLFRYISGDNEAREDIAMTAPVMQKKRSEKIAMTAPVGQRATESGWAVSFMLPASYTIDTAPTPTDPAVRLRAIPVQRMASIRYSGRWTEKNYLRHLAMLNEWMEKEGLRAAGAPVWARYNAPFTPPFWRRNEILIPIES